MSSYVVMPHFAHKYSLQSPLDMFPIDFVKNIAA